MWTGTIYSPIKKLFTLLKSLAYSAFLRGAKRIIHDGLRSVLSILRLHIWPGTACLPVK